MQQRTYKLRLYPNKEQEQALQRTLDNCRFMYNLLLEGLNNQPKPNRLDLQNSIPKLKEQYQWLKNTYAKTLQYESYRLFSNLRALVQLKKKGRKVGRLRFKGKNWFKTFTVNQSGFKVIETDTRLDRLHLSKIGDIPMKIHRAIKGTIKQIIVKHYRSGKWYACICTETDSQPAHNESIKNAVGIDVGWSPWYLTDSDGRQIGNPHNLKKSLKKLRRVQRRHSRRKKGSNNRDKQRIKVAHTHEKVVNQRNDFQHKLSRYYINHYDMVAVEDLNIQNMIDKNFSPREIADASWGSFYNMLVYKAESAGKLYIKVDPRGTSKERNYGSGLDNHHNASLNILKRGLEKLPQGLREVTPVEIVPLRELTPVLASTVVEAGSSLR